ncbi:MAG: hypothetical protein QOH93_1240 [Chloroflexia bacterium]|jgi:hypothetical protein|nr:hypothetical protein [Chloroflexia bacterium]
MMVRKGIKWRVGAQLTLVPYMPVVVEGRKRDRTTGASLYLVRRTRYFAMAPGHIETEGDAVWVDEDRLREQPE